MTGFNQLDLPAYTSFEILQKKLAFAFREASEGFAIA
jgi:hypothetical protein